MKRNESLRIAVQEFQSRVLALKAKGDLFCSEILDVAEPPDNEPDAHARTQAAWAVTRLEKLIRDVMGSYDALISELGEPPAFSRIIAVLQANEGDIEE